MKDEKILNEEQLHDEELEKVAGGTFIAEVHKHGILLEDNGINKNESGIKIATR